MNLKASLSQLPLFRGRTLSRRRFLGLAGIAVVTTGCADGSGENPATTTEVPVTRSSSSSAAAGTASSEPGSIDGPPNLVITFPVDGATFCGHPRRAVPHCSIDGPDLTFEGTVTAGSSVFSDRFAANVRGERWSISLRLTEGDSLVHFVARGPDGQESTESVHVAYYEFEPSFL